MGRCVSMPKSDCKCPIQTMTTTLYALGVSSEQLPVYKALVVILICLLQSEKFKGVLEKRTAEKAVKQR